VRPTRSRPSPCTTPCHGSRQAKTNDPPAAARFSAKRHPAAAVARQRGYRSTVTAGDLRQQPAMRQLPNRRRNAAGAAQLLATLAAPSIFSAIPHSDRGGGPAANGALAGGTALTSSPETALEARSDNSDCRWSLRIASKMRCLSLAVAGVTLRHERTPRSHLGSLI